MKFYEKHFSKIFWAMLIVAGYLTFTATDKLENRLDTMESKIEDIDTMLKEMIK